MSNLGSTANLVSTEFLAAHLKDVRVVDASWYMPDEKRQPAKEFEAAQRAPAPAEERTGDEKEPEGRTKDVEKALERRRREVDKELAARTRDTEKALERRENEVAKAEQRVAKDAKGLNEREEAARKLANEAAASSRALVPPRTTRATSRQPWNGRASFRPTTSRSLRARRRIASRSPTWMKASPKRT